MNFAYSRFLFSNLLLVGIIFQNAYGANQTPDITPILPGSELPFTVTVELADFSLPQGVQSYVYGEYNDKILILTGRIQGLHGFNDGNNNFPPNKQNTTVFVVDLAKEKVYSRSLLDPSSGLTQEQVDLLSVTSAQHIQTHDTLYITGGYGVDSSTGQFSTKNCLTAIDIPSAIHWVTHPKSSKKLSSSIRQVFDDTFRVTGGVMRNGRDGLALLMFGQDFEGFYTGGSNGSYTQQVRRFYIFDDGRDLSVKIINPIPFTPDPNYRRRDLNIVPTIRYQHCQLVEGFVALSGVFTLADGAWTVPVIISDEGSPSMADPNDPSTFKQGMNNYECATTELFSLKTGDMYVINFGGISYGYFQNRVFNTDPELPFINQITTIKIDKKGRFSQYLMGTEFPVIYTTEFNPPRQLLFGTDADFFPAHCIPKFQNNVLILDALPKEPVLVGYIIGGIQSSLPNTNFQSDSAASPFIFKVILKRNK